MKKKRMRSASVHFMIKNNNGKVAPRRKKSRSWKKRQLQRGKSTKILSRSYPNTIIYSSTEDSDTSESFVLKEIAEINVVYNDTETDPVEFYGVAKVAQGLTDIYLGISLLKLVVGMNPQILHNIDPMAILSLLKCSSVTRSLVLNDEFFCEQKLDEYRAKIKISHLFHSNYSRNINPYIKKSGKYMRDLKYIDGNKDVDKITGKNIAKYLHDNRSIILWGDFQNYLFSLWLKLKDNRKTIRNIIRNIAKTTHSRQTKNVCSKIISQGGIKYLISNKRNMKIKRKIILLIYKEYMEKNIYKQPTKVNWKNKFHVYPGSYFSNPMSNLPNFKLFGRNKKDIHLIILDNNEQCVFWLINFISEVGSIMNQKRGNLLIFVFFVLKNEQQKFTIEHIQFMAGDRLKGFEFIFQHILFIPNFTEVDNYMKRIVSSIIEREAMAYAGILP
eukprot:TRINITY_DN5961_c0_g1_i1.p1 TRINITY_DN5961_c0_g1~~TRINITY_DN5961_c0_g1_i1.p1  ORF type:complete len:502 (-),score=72.50 TRINITY_DN5961_c0_g1_i1:284-1615(-)